jgi:hypothetical protein
LAAHAEKPRDVGPGPAPAQRILDMLFLERVQVRTKGGNRFQSVVRIFQTRRTLR